MASKRLGMCRGVCGGCIGRRQRSPSPPPIPLPNPNNNNSNSNNNPTNDHNSPPDPTTQPIHHHPPHVQHQHHFNNTPSRKMSQETLAQLLELAASNPDLFHFQKMLISWLKSYCKCSDVAILLHCKESDCFHCQNIQERIQSLIPSSLREKEKIISTSLVPVEAKVAGLVGILALYHNNSQTEEKEVEALRQHLRVISSLLAIVANVDQQRRLYEQSGILLGMAQNVFSSLEDMSTLVRNITKEAKTLIQAETCSLFLMDKEHGELVAEVFEKNGLDDEYLTEIRLPLTEGIAGHVATTSTLMNVPDAYNHPMFYKDVDERTGFHTRNILCFPIKDTKGEVVGVAELCNKIGRPSFNHHDERIAATFSVYCAISISHCLLYRKLREAHRRTHLASELMTYDSHLEVAEEDVLRLDLATVRPTSSIHPNFNSLKFLPRSIGSPLGAHEAQLEACVSMFNELQFTERYRIPKKRLARFLLMVQKGYRQVPYHNWSHAFSVAHFCYLLLKTDGATQSLSQIHRLSLFVACLCHDIDHRGTNNAFQVKSQTPLAQLYSSEGSVLERHHFAQTMCILNMDDCNFFENVPSKDYNEILDRIRDIILASDVAQHFKKIDKMKAMIERGFDPNAKEDIYLLLSLLMTASDLADQGKPWKFSKTIALTRVAWRLWVVWMMGVTWWSLKRKTRRSRIVSRFGGFVGGSDLVTPAQNFCVNDLRQTMEKRSKQASIYTEFFSQGDLERAMGNTPAEGMDRQKACIPKLQLNFLDVVAIPVFKMLAKLVPGSTSVYEEMEDGRECWEILGGLVESDQKIEDRVFQKFQTQNNSPSSAGAGVADSVSSSSNSKKNSVVDNIDFTTTPGGTSSKKNSTASSSRKNTITPLINEDENNDNQGDNNHIPGDDDDDDDQNDHEGEDSGRSAKDSNEDTETTRLLKK